MAIILTGYQEVSGDVSIFPEHLVEPSVIESDILADLREGS